MRPPGAGASGHRPGAVDGSLAAPGRGGGPAGRGAVASGARGGERRAGFPAAAGRLRRARAGGGRLHCGARPFGVSRHGRGAS